MALFENYERRIDKINGVLAQYGIASVEECREICKAKGFDPYEIAAGIQQSVAKRCFVMAKKAGAKDHITLTGGCAKNKGLKAAIENVLRIKVTELPVDPQLMGALGAAEYARQKGMEQE